MKSWNILLAATIHIFCMRAAAHHSMAMYDFEREVILQGVVRSFEWSNPHVYLVIEMSDANGDTSVATIEAAAPGALEIAGCSAHSLAPGDRVVVAANPSHDIGRPIFLGNAVLNEDGEALAMGGMRLQRALAGR